MSRSILRKRAVHQRTGLSDSTIWRLEKVGEFPERIQVTEAGAVGWFEDEIDAWMHGRVRGPGKRPKARKAAQPMQPTDNGPGAAARIGSGGRA
jgi:predicted DNA-binding transcriptional regulator AlpA